jgi:uncharacterized protein YyaL (SSP411 family)
MALRALPSAPEFPSELRARLAAVSAALSGRAVHARHRGDDDGPCYTNRLALESSPYLLGHAHNPVNWYPWGDEAFADAQRLDRPVFLSIGYSTCHWCHVMEEESFEDEAIAAFMNASYLSIKVDREERPDVDAIYMHAAQRLTGSGGWPLSVWLTPNREPFFAGTYFPPRAGVRGSEVGFLEILSELLRLYREEPARVQQAAQALTQVVRSDIEVSSQAARPSSKTAPSHLSLVDQAVEQCARTFDEEHGGLRVRQKFPSQVPIRLLLRHAQRTGDENALHMAVHTLESMARGGIYDHLVGGFHRYATDERWLVPHFEKMLYDNALLVPAYAEAWQATKRDHLLRIVRETCDEMLATFSAPNGGFFSATDADSEGEEGTFYLWTEDEIRAVLGPAEETDLFLRHYGVTATGNFEGRNILHEARSDEESVRRLSHARAELARVRRRRIAPLRDDKILAAWNGLAISAFATAGWIASEQRYLDAAKRAAIFATEQMRDPATGLLARSFRDGRLGVPGFLGDYACVASGLLDLFEYTSEARWFDHAVRLCEDTERLFADSENGGWFSSSAQHEQLLAREKPSHDGAEPSGGSMALLNAARLATLTDDPRWRQVAERALRSYLPILGEQPMAMTHTLLAVDFMAGPVREIAVALPSPAGASSNPLVQCLRETFCPRKVLVVGDPASTSWQDLQDKIPYLADKTAMHGRATAYVCDHGHCQLPTEDVTILRHFLGG